ncbi:hypothetical protein BT96DRAFT_926526 [Gymnopus androsaceus JB14]|uniref:Uncharacterized protein n=1 Tax=Gymnopus androsaceus JB14 TaxID=1447944 RepID=A0A6A4GUR7_9AGAR|nr:hypothetical protein BT96DRAFT_926526 [Gymnopus androsaceus JB14]
MNFFGRDYIRKILYYSNHIPGAIYNVFQVKSLAKFIIIYFIFFRINFGCFIIDPAE